MKKVLIIPSNTDLNRGDQALVWESISLVEDVYGKEKVSCMIMSDLEGHDSYLQNRQTAKLNCQFVPPIIGHPGRKYKTNKRDSIGYSKITIVQWGVQAIKDYFHTRLLLTNSSFLRQMGEFVLSQKEKAALNQFLDCDVVYVKGGGFIHSYGGITDPYFMYFLTFHIRLAAAYGKDVILLPNSVGPLNNVIAKRIALEALKKCTLITVRENISKVFLNDFNLSSSLFPDLGFFLKPSETDMKKYLLNHGIPLNQKKVAITLRPYRFQGYDNANNLYTNYVNGVVSLVKYLNGQGFHISFIAHTLGPSSHEDDRIAINNVLDHLPEHIKNDSSYIEDFDLNCKEIEKIYSYYDYMVGTRFHSVIFSLNVGVPSIAIAYGGNKSKGIMTVLGNGEYSIDIDKVDDKKLIQLFVSLEANKETYLENLHNNQLFICKERNRLICQIRKLHK